MRIRLKKWIIKQTGKNNPADLALFLKMLKYYPEQVLVTIADNMGKWAIACMMESKSRFLFANNRKECNDLLKALQEHYAKQLAEIDGPIRKLDAKFLAWLIVRHDKLSLGIKQKFLRLLKLSPNGVLREISSQLSQWRLNHIIATGEVTACCDHQGEPQEILEAFQNHFAPQLAEISAE